MSKYGVVRTEIRDAEALAAALKLYCQEHGLQFERHDGLAQLVGYEGDARQDRAQFILRRRYVGRSSNDVGWVRGDDGTFQAIVSDFDRRNGAAMGIVGKVENWAKVYQKARVGLRTLPGARIGGQKIENGKLQLVVVQD